MSGARELSPSPGVAQSIRQYRRHIRVCLSVRPLVRQPVRPSVRLRPSKSHTDYTRHIVNSVIPFVRVRF